MTWRCWRGAAAIAVVVIAAACGPDDSVVEPGRVSSAARSTVAPRTTPSTVAPATTPSTVAVPATIPGWLRSELGEAPVDGSPVAATNGRTTVVVAGSASGPRAWVSEGGGDFTPAEMTGTGDDVLYVFDVVAAGDGFIAIGNGHPSFVPRVWRSTDGEAWELVETVGLRDPADVHRLVRTPAGLAAIGARRLGGDPAMGPFAPSVWVSSDGVTWSERTSPVSDDGSWIIDAVAIDGALVATTQSHGTTQAWRSTDDAASWSQSPIDGVVRPFWVGSLATDGRVLLGVASLAEDMVGGDPAILRSDDGGRSFAVSPLGSLVQGAIGELGMRTTFAAGAWWATTSRYTQSWSDPDTCYRDPAACAGGAKAVLLRSVDGVEWSELDTSSMIGAYGQFAVVVDDPGGPLVVGSEQQLTTWRWPSDDAPPARPPYEAPPPLETPLAAWGATIERGVTYRYPLHIHCGMDVLGQFNGTHWYRTDGEAGEQPAPHWPVAQETIFGYLTLVDDDTIEYAIADGEVIATYQPSADEPPGCD